MSSYEFVKRARGLVDDGQYQEAVKICRLGLLAQPKDLDGRLVLGAALIALRRHDEVLAEMRVALEIDADSARALALKGEALLRKGDAVQATEVLERARAQEPGSEDIRTLYQEAAVAAAGDVPGDEAPPQPPVSEFERDVETRHYPAQAARPAGKGQPPPSIGSAAGDFEDDETHVSGPPELEALGIGDAGAGALDDSGVEREPLAADELAREVESFDDSGDRPPSPFETSDWFHDANQEEATAIDELFGLRGSGAENADEERQRILDESARRIGSMFPDEDGPDGPATSPVGDARAAQPPSAPPAQPQAAPPAPPAGYGAPAAASQVPGAPQGAAPGLASGTPAQPGAAGHAPATGQPGPPPNDGSGHPPLAYAEDMRTIRAGLGLEADSTGSHQAQAQAHAHAGARGAVPGPEPTATVPHSRSEPQVRRKSRPWLYGVVAIAVAGGAVFAGLEVRNRRLDAQIEKASARAAESARQDTFAGLLAAESEYERIAGVRDSAGIGAAHARAMAALAFEFGHERERALAAVAAVEADTFDAAVAQTYAALIRAEPDAGDLAEAVRERAEDDPVGAYLAGWAALAGGDRDAAATALEEAADTKARPRALLALAVAERERGELVAADDALARAAEIVPDHPELAIERARLAAQRGGGDGDELAARADELEALVAGAEAEDAGRLADDTVAWARLALAEVERARGDDEAAAEALAAVGEPDAIGGWRLAEAAAEVALALGDTARARAVCRRAVDEWPDRTRARVLLAEAALGAGEPEAALAALRDLGDLGGNARGLTVRGRAYLTTGALAAAAADLDRALEIEKAPEALVARAEVERRGGDVQAALARLRPVYERGETPRVAVALAAALRDSGETDRARDVLESLDVGSSLGSSSYLVSLERARLERAEGRFDEAREAYARAAENALTLVPKLEAAEFAIETGHVAGGRDLLVKLAEDASDSGPVLVQAARGHALAGELDEADEYLDRVAELSSVPKAALHRERGRLALRRRKVEEAVGELEKSAELDPTDRHTWLLLIDANAAREDGDALQKTVEQVVKRFVGAPIADIARGRNHLYNDRTSEALASFQSAVRGLKEARALPRRRAKPHLLLGRLHYDLGDLEKAIAELERATGLDPSHAGAHLLLGNVRFERQEYEEAAEAYESSLEFDPSSTPEVWFYLGDAAARAGKKELARTALETYKEKAPEGAFASTADRLLKEL